MSPVHCTIVIFASFFLTDQFKSNFKIADQDLFYDTMAGGRKDEGKNETRKAEERG